MDKNHFKIGAYILQPYARTEKHIRDIKNAGIDFIVGMDSDVKTLDLFAKYSIGAIINDVLPYWYGGNGSDAGKMQEVNDIEKYRLSAGKFKDHRAIIGLDIGDEPSALDMHYYAEVIKEFKKFFSGKLAYLNLYPIYASVANSKNTVSQLGTRTYAEYIEEYCKNIPLDYICFDHYLYANGDVLAFFDNLRIVSEAARRYGRNLWFVGQVNSNKPNVFISENMLRFQAFSAMAFGAEAVIWACYTAGWWYNHVVDEKGNMTCQYKKLQKVNKEIVKLGSRYMKYRNTATYLLKGTDEFENACFNGLKSDKSKTLLVGEMISRQDKNLFALFVVAVDDYKDVDPSCSNVVFRHNAESVAAYSKDGEKPLAYDIKTGICTVEIKSNDYIFIEGVL